MRAVDRRAQLPFVRLLILGLLGCLAPIPPVLLDCKSGSLTPPGLIPGCLATAGTLGASDRARADSLIAVATALRDSLSKVDAGGAHEITGALQHLGDFYGNGAFADSGRFDRMLDHLAVTLEHARGALVDYNGRMFPLRTPWLSWHDYPDIGIYFQPVNTMQEVEWLMPRPDASDDSVVAMSERLYQYALWREADGRRFPVWEYEFPWTSGGVAVKAPWISGLAEGLGLALFADAYRRTNDPVWRTRTYEILNAMYVPWQDGGVLLPDTSHGYWWEEYHPTVQVWNGSAWALLGVGYAAQVTGDPEISRLFSRGIDALKYYTPLYDTGTWTLYSRTQGYNTVAYHTLCIDIMDAFYARTGDPWFKTVADRWRSYVPPPGVQ